MPLPQKKVLEKLYTANDESYYVV